MTRKCSFCYVITAFFVLVAIPFSANAVMARIGGFGGSESANKKQQTITEAWNAPSAEALGSAPVKAMGYVVPADDPKNIGTTRVDYSDSVKTNLPPVVEKDYN